METIRFRDHEKFVLNLLSTLADRSEDSALKPGECEVVLMSNDGKPFLVSSSFLKNVSGFFKDLLLGSESDATLMLPDMSGEAIRVFLKIIHFGSVTNVHEDTLKEIIDLSKMFGLSISVENETENDDFSPHSMILDDAQVSDDSSEGGKKCLI